MGFNDASDLIFSVSASGFTSTYAYDSRGRQTLATEPDGSYATYDYSLTSARTKVIDYEIVGGSTLSYRNDFALDDEDRVIQSFNQGPDGTFGNGDDQTTTFAYDGAGRQTQVIDEAGRSTVYAYDALSRQTSVTEDSGGIARLTKSEYDRASRLLRLIAYTDSPSTGPQTTSYAYNDRSLESIVTYEETGNVSHGYDSVGNLTKRTDEEGIVVDYKYDDVNRLTERLRNGASTGIDKYVFDGLGRMVTAQVGTTGTPNAVARSIFSYDDLSRVTKEAQEIAVGGTRDIKYTHDKGSNRITTIYPSNVTTLTYAYDSRDRGTAINKNGLTLASYTWIGGAVSKRQVTSQQTYVCGGSTDRMAYKTEFQRDGILRVSKAVNELTVREQAITSRNNLGSWTYAYDAASNPTTETHTGHTMAQLESSRSYAYDTLNRLTNALVTDSQAWAGLAQSTTTYSYDDLGNRISHSNRGTTAIGHGHDKANRMTTLARLSPFSPQFHSSPMLATGTSDLPVTFPIGDHAHSTQQLD